ncbi:carbonic anhydrase [Crucibulum laeve]|uniref:carbonic anhydrase n=1 Tax=Crucibulum laeve TaxID=68775 RepID=A0A5C3M132_9AGAR|nr:carbonic anhydrase [Crucibulum laeve]
MFASKALFALAAISLVLAHPVSHRREWRIVGRTESVNYVRAEVGAAAFDSLSAGNQAFRDNLVKTDPTLLKTLTDDGQTPPFMFLGCSDSRVSEGTVFNAKPGTLFTQRNIANQFHTTDPNAHSVLSYAVAELGVEHVIVMGHYGCGGVAASIATPPANQIDAANGAVQNWIDPIREIFRSSTRAEIVELRERIKSESVVEEPDISEPGFRALVEENVKASVARIATDSVITNHFALLAAGNATAARRAEGGAAANVFIHGWVYDIETGEVKDLGISVGPPGVAIPPAPFAAVVGAAESHASAETNNSAAKTEVKVEASKPAETKAEATTIEAAKPAAETKAAETKSAEAAKPSTETKAAAAATHSSPVTIHPIVMTPKARCGQLCKVRRMVSRMSQ